MNATIETKAAKYSARTAWALTLFLYWVVLSTGCTQAEYHTVNKPAPVTGVPLLEIQKAKDPITNPKVGDKGYVSPDRMNSGDGEISVDQNDEVEITKIIGPKGPGSDCEVVVGRVTKSEHPANLGKQGRFCLDYINTKPVKNNSRFFMIQNIATEKLRVYEKCQTVACAHRLVLEIDMVAGENIPEKRSHLGVYWISDWFKFYQDENKFYPPWYSEELPVVPQAGSSFEEWMSTSLLPKGRGKVRGAFGWYTAHLEPNASAQWTHGTIGRGADGSKFIDHMRASSNDRARQLRSDGCTRVENRAITLIHDLMPEGALLIKIYAREAMTVVPKNKDAADYNWTVYKNDREILEKGTLKVNQTPSAVGFTEARGNLYGVDQNEFGGLFYTDIGRLESYHHPKSLEAGGHSDRRLPGIVVKK